MSSAAPAVDKSHWAPDASAPSCQACEEPFSLAVRRAHCRGCGRVLCRPCAQWKVVPLKRDGSADAEGAAAAAPERSCLECAVAAAKAATGVPECPAGEPIAAIEVGTNKEETFENVRVARGAELAAVRGGPNAKVNLSNCHVEGVLKESNGHVKMDHCVVSGDTAIEVGGNNKVDLRNCVIVGRKAAVRIFANAKLEAHNCYFIGLDPESKGITMEANAKATLVTCVVTAADGVVGKALSMVTTKEGGSIAGQHAPLGAFLSPNVAVACKSELDSSTVIVGTVKPKLAEPSPIAKMFGNTTMKKERAAARAKAFDVHAKTEVPERAVAAAAGAAPADAAAAPADDAKKADGGEAAEKEEGGDTKGKGAENADE
jgi:hypothetical protein